MKRNLQVRFYLAVMVLSLLLALFFGAVVTSARMTSRLSEETPTYQYPFQNPDLPLEDRVNNILSLMTLDEKVACLGTNPSVPSQGIKGSGHVEGIHGLTQGGPGK